MFVTKKRSFTATASFWLALLALLLLALAPLGYRLQWWDFPVAIKLVTGGGMLIALLAFLFALIGIVRTGRNTIYIGRGKAILGFLLSVAILGCMGYQAYLGATLNYHDVTTDTSNPPSLAAFTNAEGRKNSVDYDTQLIPLQSKDYPQIKPLIVNATLENVQNTVVELVKEYEWELVKSDVNMVLATETSALYQFKDDIAIRFTAITTGSNAGRIRVDMRSNSRVGESDLGQNAARIECFLTELAARI